MMEQSRIINQEQQFNEVVRIIQQHRSKASQAVNEQMLLTAWHIGGYVSAKLKSEEWGSKVVNQLSEFIRAHHPYIKGYSRSSIYNMVMLYDEYSSPAFLHTVEKYLRQDFIQPVIEQIESSSQASTENEGNTSDVIVQTASGQLQKNKSHSLSSTESENGKPATIVQTVSAQLPKILTYTTLSNLIEITCHCNSSEERLFYILYAHKEKLAFRELQRSITNQTYSSLLGDKKNMSKGLLQTYPAAPILFKDKLFVDFLGLPQKHSETRLKNGLIDHMKQFILELGKDFIFMEQEYQLTVGASTFKADLLFYHRGLQALVAVELKKTKFHPRDLGQLEFYLEALDRDVKRSNENPSIGILLCPETDKVVVEYAMSRSMSPTMIAEYKRILIPREQMQQELNEYCGFFLENKKP